MWVVGVAASYLCTWPHKVVSSNFGTSCFYSFTKSSKSDLHTQLVFAADQKDSGKACLRQGSYPNPNWVEWLMGYPADWTKLLLQFHHHLFLLFLSKLSDEARQDI